MKNKIKEQIELKINGMKQEWMYIQDVQNYLLSTLDTVDFLMSLTQEEENEIEALG